MGVGAERERVQGKLDLALWFCSDLVLLQEEHDWGKPSMRREGHQIHLSHKSLGEFSFSFVDPAPSEIIFCENETNVEKVGVSSLYVLN